MEIAKALILAGSVSDDPPWPAVPSGPKQLFPLANRPILFHNLEALRNAGLLEAVVLVERDSAPAIERAVGDGSDWGMRVRYAEYVPAVGLAGALAAGRDFLGGEGVLVQRGDALLHERMHPHLAAFARERLDALALELAGDASVTVPRAPAPGYVLSPEAVSILLDRPEAGLDPLAGVRARGGRVRVQHVDGSLPCHGSQDSLLHCNRRLLEGLQGEVEPSSLENCELQGAVVVHPLARLERTMVRGPAIIGPGSRLTDAYVGPYTSIGADVVLEGAEIEHSIVLRGAELRFIGTRIESSVIGQGARVVRGFGVPSAIRLTVGDGAQVILA
jgi:glucose-1-phosphate thymidylyltransferase